MSDRPEQTAGYLAADLAAIGITGIRVHTARFCHPIPTPADRPSEPGRVG